MLVPKSIPVLDQTSVSSIPTIGTSVADINTRPRGNYKTGADHVMILFIFSNQKYKDFRSGSFSFQL